MLFWIIAIALIIGSAAVLVRALLLGQVGDLSAAAYDLQIYRDQLAEVERDQSRGLLTPEDAERTRTEISRRILAADAVLRKETGSRNARSVNWLGAAALVLILAGGAWLIYDSMGAPGYPDMALSSRQATVNLPTQSMIEAMLPPRPPVEGVPEDFVTLIERLRDLVAQRPDDLRGQMLLARNEAIIGNYSAAHAAQAQVLALKKDEATADDYATYAVMLVTAANGAVSKEAYNALQATLARDAAEPRARYYMGLFFMQVDRPDRTFRIWRDLLENSPPDSVWFALIRNQIEAVAEMAGVRYSPPSGPTMPDQTMPGPDASDMQAAGQMSDDDRQKMIRGMVSQLADRLANQGGSAAEWVRLIGAYGVLGETDKARTAWSKAQEVFAKDPEALDQLRQAAGQAGVAQ